MARAIKATERGLMPHYKVRVVLPGALVHLASWDEPRHEGSVMGWVADWISDPEYGDTVGWIDWDRVVAITWRWSE